MSRPDLLIPTERGLFCPAGDFYIDPWSGVDRAVVTHAHGDHLTWGCGSYLVAAPGKGLAEQRLGGQSVDQIEYGEQRTVNGVTISLHPAGHILGSAQVRVELQGQVWVVSGDYKTDPDPTCTSFELVRANVFITESTFGLPIYRWPREREVRDALLSWHGDNRAAGRSSVLLAYPLGKSQRLLAMLLGFDGPIWTHGAVETMTARYREAGVPLPPTIPVNEASPKTDWAQGIVIGPPSVQASPWLRRFGDASRAFASGWMLVRGARRRRNVDRGFVLSDHVDWPALIATIEATGAERVLATHGFVDAVARYLTERGVDAGTLATRWEGERDDATEDLPPAAK